MFSWKRLPRGIKAIFFVQIVNRMGDFVVPFLTLILTQIQGMKPAEAGLVVTLASALGSLGNLVSGKLSDGRSRRDVLLVFLGTSGTLLGAAGFAPAHVAAAVAMVAAGFFLGGMRPVLGALIADLAPPDLRRTAFSLSYLGINIGVAVGPLLAGWLFAHALSWMFWLDALSTACALLILVRAVPRHTQPLPTAPVSDSPSQPAHSLAAFVRHPVLFPFALITLAYNLVYAQLIFSQSLQLVDLFGTAGPGLFGVVWAVNAVTVVVLTPVVMRLTARWTNLRSMAWATVFFALGIAVFLFHPNAAMVIVSAVVWSTGEVLFSVHNGDFIAGQSPPEYRGRFQSYVSFVTSLGHMAAPVLGGLIAQALGLTGVWWAAVVLACGCGVGYSLLQRRLR